MDGQLQLCIKTQSDRENRLIIIEDFARRHSEITVNYRGEEGTFLIGCRKVDFEDIITEMNEMREDYWSQMASKNTSNSQVSELGDKRSTLKYVRNKLQRAINNPSHRWRRET